MGVGVKPIRACCGVRGLFCREVELELIQTHMALKPVLRVEVGACVARAISAERGGMGERGCAWVPGEWV